MANSFKFQDKIFHIGDTVSLTYKISEDKKERQQKFSGIIINVRGQSDQDRMMTIRKTSRSGIGVERIIPLASPHFINMKTTKKTQTTRAKVGYIRFLSQQEIRRKIYRQK